MRATALAILMFTATIAVSVAPTALAECYQPETTTYEAAGATVAFTTYDCAYDYGPYASSFNSTDVRVGHDALGASYHVVYREQASSYHGGDIRSANDQMHFTIYEGDAEWSSQKRVTVDVYDHQNTYGGRCSGVSDTWVDLWFHGIGHYQGVWTRSGTTPWGDSYLLPCDWNDAVLA